MGKVKKSNSTPHVETKKVPLGQRVQYIGVLGARFVCPVCGITKRKAIVVSYESKLFCSEDCIRMSLPRG